MSLLKSKIEIWWKKIFDVIESVGKSSKKNFDIYESDFLDSEGVAYKGIFLELDTLTGNKVRLIFSMYSAKDLGKKSCHFIDRCQKIGFYYIGFKCTAKDIQNAVYKMKEIENKLHKKEKLFIEEVGKYFPIQKADLNEMSKGVSFYLGERKIPICICQDSETQKRHIQKYPSVSSLVWISGKDIVTTRSRLQEIYEEGLSSRPLHLTALVYF